MIKIEELRIGNYVGFLSETVKITGIHKPEGHTRYLISTDEFRDSKAMHYKPIPLDEQWLLDFGFNREPWGLIKDNLLFKDPKVNCKTLILEVGNGNRTEIKYVHQLQNLYYALTNKELNKQNL